MLGRGGDFSEVRYKIPEGKFMDFKVRGPAGGRAILREQKEQRIQEEAMKASETEKERKEREKKDKAEERRLRRERKREDWRTNQVRRDVDRREARYVCC
jgi:hypothetical protein